MTELVVVPDLDAMAELAVDRVSEAAAQIGAALFSLVLAGGSTPQRFHRALALRPTFPWWRTLVLFGDDRVVPPSHEDSNYRAAKASLLDRVSPAGLLRIPTEAPDPVVAAQAYEAMLTLVPGGRTSVTVLGMGEDGHTASLFPGVPVPEDRDVMAVPEPSPGLHPRVSVTDRFLERAGLVLVLVSGAAKAERLAEVLAQSRAGEGEGALPLARVLRRRAGKRTIILADEASAEHLPRGREGGEGA